MISISNNFDPKTPPKTVFPDRTDYFDRTNVKQTGGLEKPKDCRGSSFDVKV